MATATATLFGIGDGATQAFVLGTVTEKADASKPITVSAIYKDSVQLVTFSRTNLILQSGSPSTTPWAFSGVSGTPTATPNALTAPDGTLTATRFTYNFSTAWSVRQDVTVVPGTTYVFSFWIYNLNSNQLRYSIKDMTHNVDLVNQTYTESIGVWDHVIQTVTAPAGCTSIRFFPHRDSNLPTDIGLWGVQVEDYTQLSLLGITVGDYIPTTTAQASIVDYTLSGATVTFGRVPKSGSQLQWSGTYTPLISYVGFFLNSSASIAQLETIEISHPNFIQTYRVVRNHSAGITAKLEDGTTVQFTYYPLRITSLGTRTNLEFGVRVDFGDLGLVLPANLDAISSAGGYGTKPIVKYRTYRSDNLDAILFGPLILEVSEFSFTREGSSFEAKAPQLNLSKVGEFYTFARFPMLRGFL